MEKRWMLVCDECSYHIKEPLHFCPNCGSKLVVQVQPQSQSQTITTKIPYTQEKTGIEGGSAIIISDLVKQFEDVTAVDGIKLEIKRGELFSLLGPNGAGKTTIINILCGILKPTKGTAIIEGYDVKKNLKKIKRLIGVCPQKAAVFTFLNARENIELFGSLHAIPKNVLKERTDTFLESLDFVDASLQWWNASKTKSDNSFD
jgi:ABC-type uncharacterized transport system ATPase subunit